MIKVAFLLNFPLSYKGGINYLKNLYYAIKKVNNQDFEVVLFVPKDLPQEYIDLFSPFAELITTNVIKRKNLLWVFDKICQRYLGYGPLTEMLLKKYEINVLSHSNYVSKNKVVKTINWIPDFQYLYYPDLWPAKQLENTKRLHRNFAEKSDLIVLSSNDALKDFKSVYPLLADKVRVLHFVSQPTSMELNVGEDDLLIAKKYADGKPFFYLPNQFWSHKNHILAFRAAKILREKGFDFMLLTSGVMEDFRSKNDHIGFLRNFVGENDLSSVIKFLGVIPYAHVLSLIKTAEAVINPSFFEGWSSTVEEARTLGANLLLSDILVHREQNPPNANYIDPSNEDKLAYAMEQVLTNTNSLQEDVDILKQSLDQRTTSFGNTYLNIIKEIT